MHVRLQLLLYALAAGNNGHTCSGQNLIFVVWLALLVVGSLHIQDRG